MEILPYEPGMAAVLSAMFDDALQPVPHCHSVKPETVQEELAEAGGDRERSLRKQQETERRRAGRLRGERSWPSRTVSEGRLDAERALVAFEKGEAIGLVHAAVEMPKREEETKQGIIRFLWYRPGGRKTGALLLQAAETHLREQDVPGITAFHQDYIYPFYHFDHAYLSVQLGHVHALLGMAGYNAVGGEVFLDWPDCGSVVVPDTEVEADFSVEYGTGSGRLPGVKVLASAEETRLGVCESISGGEFSDADEAQEWLWTEWLGVRESMQGKGLGAHLLCRAVKEASRVGYRHAAISTSWRNWRALILYTNYGYRVVDWTYCLRRAGECSPIGTG
jgi:GNAT superfamily N-acetyltransferase